MLMPFDNVVGDAIPFRARMFLPPFGQSRRAPWETCGRLGEIDLSTPEGDGVAMGNSLQDGITYIIDLYSCGLCGQIALDAIYRKWLFMDHLPM